MWPRDFPWTGHTARDSELFPISTVWGVTHIHFVSVSIAEQPSDDLLGLAQIWEAPDIWTIRSLTLSLVSGGRPLAKNNGIIFSGIQLLVSKHQDLTTTDEAPVIRPHSPGQPEWGTAHVNSQGHIATRY